MLSEHHSRATCSKSSFQRDMCKRAPHAVRAEGGASALCLREIRYESSHRLARGRSDHRV